MAYKATQTTPSSETAELYSISEGKKGTIAGSSRTQSKRN